MEKFEHLVAVGPGFYNIRAPFKLAFGLIDIGTHMSLCSLPNGNFLVIDTVKLEPAAKAEFDRLTDNGRKIEAVVATHPFHTLAFRPFHSTYPNAKYYGTPRHLRIMPDIPWAGDVNCSTVRALWEPHVSMRIPAGSEFVDPKPPKSNHFSNVFVFHRESRTVHNDDTILYSADPGFLMRLLLFKKGNMAFHPSIKGPGLLPTQNAPFEFRAWLEQLMEDWDFDNLCSAHQGCKVGGAKQMLRETLERATDLLKKISDENAKGKRGAEVGAWSDKPEDGEECG
eukprot:GGOE01013952.1.p1 GENE.GGOE01013952.1~~GGOE01013952.1.p1  ORF type:complete len:295 (+),score=91.90 GGOE01013952.1:37-885(+)